MLSFSARHAAPATVTTQRIDAGDALTRLVRMFRPLLGPGLVVRCTIAEDVPLIETSHAAFDQVIMNLMLNAGDAMPRGGELDLRVCRAAPPNGDGADGAVGVEITVADTGVGIADEHLPRIFEPYFTTKPAGRGTGLGLATVRQLVADHGGSVVVSSRVGVGTTFRVWWPARAG
jgi:signal transduction histidine kinase